MKLHIISEVMVQSEKKLGARITIEPALNLTVVGAKELAEAWEREYRRIFLCYDGHESVE